MERNNIIEYKFGLMNHINFLMHEVAKNFNELLMKFYQFTNDIEWTLPLTEKIVSKEIEIFRNFNVECNRAISMW